MFSDKYFADMKRAVTRQVQATQPQRDDTEDQLATVEEGDSNKIEDADGNDVLHDYDAIEIVEEIM